MPRKGGDETVLVFAGFRCSLMGECDKYLEFYMSKDLIGAAELGVGQPCVQHRDRFKVAMVKKDHLCDTLATTLRNTTRRKKSQEMSLSQVKFVAIVVSF